MNVRIEALRNLEYSLHPDIPEACFRLLRDEGNSIRRIAAHEFEAAAVASDLLDRMVARGEIGADAIRSIYESEKFPPGAIGFAYNLMLELRAGIREVLLNFDWSGTGLEKEFGPGGSTQFVAISYQDDWRNVRRIDTALAKAKQSMELAAP